MNEIDLIINGKKIKAKEGQTILQVAINNGINIPHLCFDERLTPTGACRLCLVEIEGQAGLQTSCTRQIENGMVIHTNKKNILELRKEILELFISEHDLRCTTCDKDGDCLLQDYAYEYQINENKYPNIIPSNSRKNYTQNSKSISYDPTKCIRCQRCVKICAEVQMSEALTIKGRSSNVEISTGFDIDLKDSTCETCGQCISTCPTNALYEKAAINKGKAKDLENTTTTCPYCGVGCQLDLNINKKNNQIIRITSKIGCIPNDGNTCVKGRFGMDFVGKQDRLTKPLIKKDGKFIESTWDKTLDLIAKKFTILKEKYGSDALAGLSSAKTTNEDNYIMQKFVRAVFGTNNVDHCARLCHASTVAGLARAFGSGAMTNSIEEIRRAPLIFVIGSNTTECHPVIGILIRQAVAGGNTNLIVADPRKISLTDIADIHMQQLPGTDVALINAMMNVIFSEELYDKQFIKDRTENFEALKSIIKKCTPEYASKITNIPEGDIIKAARLYAKAKSASIIYSMGITQHTTGTDNVLSLANLAMLTGNVGKECSGVNPLRGQNNVQGACDLGALPNVYSGYQKVDDPEIHKKFEKEWNAKLSMKPGLTVVEIMNAAYDKKIRGLYIIGENPMLSDPDICHVEKSLKKLDFLVVQDIFLSETAQLADVVLPACSFAEKDGTFTNTERRVQRVRKAVVPPGEAKDDWKIICEISEKMKYKMHYNNAKEIQDEIAALTPIYAGIVYDRIDKTGLQWPCLDKNHNGTKFLHKDKFSRGKGKFHEVTFTPANEIPDNEYPFILTTGRMLEHWHTGTMSRRCEVLDDLVPYGRVEINPEDAKKMNIDKKDKIRLKSRRGKITVPVNITKKVKPGTVFMAFHFKESPANELTNPALDPIAKIPEFKVCAVQIEKIR